MTTSQQSTDSSPNVEQERMEVGAAGCGCPITGEVVSVGGELRGDVDGTERVEHRPGCWNAADGQSTSDPTSALAGMVPQRAYTSIGTPMWLHGCGRVIGADHPACDCCSKPGGWQALYTLAGQ